MKKTLLSIFSIMTLAMGFTACNKDAKEENIGFTASMEAVSDLEAKTVLDGIHVNWEANDQIIIYGTAGCGVFTAIPHGDNQTIADLTNGTANPGDATYYAFYPVSIATDSIHMTLPAVQVSEDGQLTEFPMYAMSSTNNLTFKNLCGALKLNLTKANTSIQAIEITVAHPINGDYTVRINGVAPSMRYDGNGSNTTTLSLTTAQDITDGHEFYIAMPHASYEGMTITLIDKDGNECVKTLKAGKTVTIGRSQVTTINLGENDIVF